MALSSKDELSVTILKIPNSSLPNLSKSKGSLDKTFSISTRVFNKPLFYRVVDLSGCLFFSSSTVSINKSLVIEICFSLVFI